MNMRQHFALFAGIDLSRLQEYGGYPPTSIRGCYATQTDALLALESNDVWWCIVDMQKKEIVREWRA